MYKKINNIYLEMPEIVVPRGHIALYIHEAKTGKLKSLDIKKNMFVTAGKNSIAQRLRGDNTNNRGEISYCALGTSSVAPQLTDTKLISEIQRKLISTREINVSADNAAEFTTFFNTSEGNGVLREAGLFGDNASATTDSGTLFCRTAINRTKSSADTLTLVWNVIIG